MEISARRFDTIGFLCVSGEVLAGDVQTLKSWLGAAEKLKLLLLIDLNGIKADSSVGAALKHLILNASKGECVVISRDESWKGPKGVVQACNSIGTPEAKRVESALSMDEKLRELQTREAGVDAKLGEILATYGKQIKDLDDMKPDDFVRMNKKVAGKIEDLIAVYSECTLSLKGLEKALSEQYPLDETVKDFAKVKAEVLAFLEARGI